jgi:hypothetical protein
LRTGPAFAGVVYAHLLRISIGQAVRDSGRGTCACRPEAPPPSGTLRSAMLRLRFASYLLHDHHAVPGAA